MVEWFLSEGSKVDKSEVGCVCVFVNSAIVEFLLDEGSEVDLSEVEGVDEGTRVDQSEAGCVCVFVRQGLKKVLKGRMESINCASWAEIARIKMVNIFKSASAHFLLGQIDCIGRR